MHSPYSPTEVRILYELAHRDGLTAALLARELGLDPAYLSRILAKFEDGGLLERVRSEADGRARILRLTDKGRATFEPLDRRSREEVAQWLAELDEAQQQQLLEAMRTIEGLLDKSHGLKYAEPFYLREPQPGDLGWIVHRQAVLYHQEYGWDESYEALVAEIVSDFVKNYDPARERCWVAERQGEIVGSVFLVKHPDHPQEVAKLRLLYVEPSARGLGLGRRLVQECERFARRAGYKKIALWTNSVLTAARHIYETEGYRLVKEEAHHSFGQDLVGETWEKAL